MIYDLLIVGGGINGAAIAREAALNGWSVLLVERDDLANATSSKSSGLIHGGLRYLEQRDFRLVAEALAERERMVNTAPHLVRPMRFVIPHINAIRPSWLVRIGLLIYDWIGGKKTLKRSRSVSRKDAAYSSPLRNFSKGFVYSDAQVDDSRLVVLNAIDAADAGAVIMTRCSMVSAVRDADTWTAELSTGVRVSARAMVNAAGPWVAEMLQRTGVSSFQHVRLVKGSHIVIPRLYEGEHAYLLQQPDRRVVFVLPWEGMTAVGTTDVVVERPEDAQIDQEEIRYLCNAINESFVRTITPDDMVSSWSGIRPLYGDSRESAQNISRDYLLELDGEGAPILTIFGGKITTARCLAEDAVAKIGQVLDRTVSPVTRTRPFPGGAIDDPHVYAAHVAATWPFLGDDRARRMAGAYGSLLPELLGQATGFGRAFGAGLTEIEVRWMRDREWARTPEDVLMRRSKCGVHMTDSERSEFVTWWSDNFE